MHRKVYFPSLIKLKINGKIKLTGTLYYPKDGHVINGYFVPNKNSISQISFLEDKEYNNTPQNISKIIKLYDSSYTFYILDISEKDKSYSLDISNYVKSSRV